MITRYHKFHILVRFEVQNLCGTCGELILRMFSQTQSNTSFSFFCSSRLNEIAWFPNWCYYADQPFLEAASPEWAGYCCSAGGGGHGSKISPSTEKQLNMLKHVENSKNHGSKALNSLSCMLFGKIEILQNCCFFILCFMAILDSWRLLASFARIP